MISAAPARDVARPGFEKLLAAICEGRVGAVRLDRSVPTRPQRPRLAHAARVLRSGRHADPRRGRHLRSAASERSASARHEGHDERDGALALPPALARSPEAEGPPRRTLPHRGGRLPQDVARPDREGSGPARPRGDRARVSPSSPSCRRCGRCISGCARNVCPCQRSVMAPRAGASSWKLPVYNTLHHLLTNPIYAGAYAFGRTGSRVTIEAGRKRIVRGFRKDRTIGRL